MTYLQLVAVTLAFLIPVQSSAQSNERDQQAVMILTQTINAAGGTDLLSGIRDFTGRGRITYYWEDEVRGTVTLRGHGSTQFRLDASLPDGMRSTIMNNGTDFAKERDGTIRSVLADTRRVAIVFPYTELVAALKEPETNILYVGLVKRHGRVAYDIRISEGSRNRADQRESSIRPTRVDYFIDPNTFSVQSVVDTVGPVAYAHYSHEIEFEDYRSIGGALAPFSITETIHGQRLLRMELAEIIFNTNVTDADFKP